MTRNVHSENARRFRARSVSAVPVKWLKTG